MDEPKTKAAQQIEVAGQQPEDTPKNWPWLRKHIVLIQCSSYAIAPGFTSSILIPAINEVAQQFQVPAQTATYLLAVHVLFLDISPFFWIPCMNAYGRRPFLIASLSLSCLAALGGGFAKSYGSLMAARVFQSFGVSAGFVLPGVIVVDLFKTEELGRKNGVWAQMVAIGAPLGGVISGPVVYYLGWPWTLWITSITNAVQTVGFVLTCPETSDSRRRNGFGTLKIRQFVEPFLILQSPHIVLVTFAYGVAFALTSVGLASIVPLAFEERYGLGTIDQGLIFLGPLSGVLLGERLAGPGSDWIMNRERHRCSTADSERLEVRLWIALPGFLLAIVGVLIFGLTLQYSTHWIAPCIGFAISNFGLQLVTAPVKTYCVDCLKSHPGSVLQFINTVRQIIAFTVPFWSPNLNARLNYGLGFGVEAIILAVFSLCCVVLLWKGFDWRKVVHVKGLVDV